MADSDPTLRYSALIQSGDDLFLSRPRRFGKSLFACSFKPIHSR
ncbi:MAG: hypothetical protein DRR16_12265 [Candidatus Parabeggiatoa sp. nov. 3]|nr:MAG: hypothetical protein DRR00_18165 [Gammaproteobacteria bacterium]RKZ66304.1 MAG: hypothetical protein DRQ99_10165 [Gammaproteobacteria bacterium]RKZ85338.1 MAG: hypothetical protein DRR16_12265 [Gammaproteobacteria bacterium]